MLRTIFFDLGGVIVDFNQKAMLFHIQTQCPNPLSKLEHILDQIQQKYEKGTLSSQELSTLLQLKHMTLEQLISAHPSIFSLKTEMIPLLQELKKRGIRLVTLSNTCEAHFVYLKEKFQFEALFDDFILSYEVQSRKPEEKIYLEALKKAQAPVCECLYVDDVEEFVLAGRSLGIDSHLFQGRDGLVNALKERGCTLDLLPI